MAIIDLINGIFAGRFWVPVDNRSLTLQLHIYNTLLKW